MNETSQAAYSKTVLDFVTVGVEFCALLEQNDAVSREDWLLQTARLLPMLYLKASLLPEVLLLSDDLPPQFVSETDYAGVRHRVAELLGAEDVYLDVFLEDMKYSEQPISAFISEDIADIYQDVRNFISVYQYRITDQMEAAVHTCAQNFKNYWGQKLVNVMRPIHTLLYDENTFMDNGTDEEALWD